MKSKVAAIASHGITCFVNRQLIYNYPESLLSEQGIMSIEHADFEGVERLALVTGGEIASTFDAPDKVKIGRCELIEEIMIGEDKVSDTRAGLGMLGRGRGGRRSVAYGNVVMYGAEGGCRSGSMELSLGTLSCLQKTMRFSLNGCVFTSSTCLSSVQRAITLSSAQPLLHPSPNRPNHPLTFPPANQILRRRRRPSMHRRPPRRHHANGRRGRTIPP